MKKTVFLILVMGLLLCAEWVTLLATKAETPSGSLKVASLGFYYKKDEKARFLDLKTQWQSEHRGELSGQKAVELADEAYQKASVESTLPKWQYQGGLSPQVFNGKLHVYNNSKDALLNVPMKVTVRVKAGILREKPDTRLTDYAYLEKTAHWENLPSKSLNVSVIAPGEDQLLEVMQFHLLDFTAKHPGQWPTQVLVQVSSPGLVATQKTISLTPDHFVIPTN